MARYLCELEGGFRTLGIDCPLLMMMSGRSLTAVETAAKFPIRLVESGPASGPIAGQHYAAEIGERKALAFDTGGTTAKLVLIEDFKPPTSRSLEVACIYHFLRGGGLPLRIPAMDLVQIGAGGGSTACLDDLKRIVAGPESARSSPGPVCHGLDGRQPTVADDDYLLGRIDEMTFAGGDITLNRRATENALADALGQSLDFETDTAAAGILETVDENMANAARFHENAGRNVRY